LVYLSFIWYSSWSFGIFFPVLVCCAEKIWQPCSAGRFLCALMRLR
jgi:hypothetical protein